MKNLYQPLQTLKPVAPDIWIADGPIVSMHSIKFPTRMSVIKLSSGRLVIHSPIASTNSLYAEINELGEVEALLAPNWIHYVSMFEWAKRYPIATRYYAPGVISRANTKNLPIPSGETIEDQNPWAPEFETLLVKGSTLHSEAVFFHRPSSTLILTDLIENFEREKISPAFASIARMAGILAPNGSMPRDMRLTFRKHKPKLRKAIETMISWNPERIIIAHGKWFEENGTEELKRAFGWLLN